ncbi:MAG TPA: response regulator [Pirellulales bacterium]|nr:response regulator [Pirellulales bacterium]
MGHKVFVVDGHRDSRESVCHFLDLNGHRANAFSTAAAFENACHEGQPGCVVLDVALPDECGLAVQRRLSQRDVAPPVIMVGRRSSARVVADAMKQGAAEFLEKPLCLQTLLHEVRRALERDSENRDRDARIAATKRRLGTLTAREREVFDAITAAQGVKQIAAQLGISPRTVDVHRARVLTKMGVETVVELVGAAHLIGLFPVSTRIEQNVPAERPKPPGPPGSLRPARSRLACCRLNRIRGSQEGD